MKKTTKTEKPVKETPAKKLKVEIRISDEQWERFNLLAKNMRLTPDQLASCMIQTHIQGDETCEPP